MLERCSIFYRQLVGRTVQQKVPLVQTHLLKYSYPICLLRVFFFLSKLNYIFHNCLWQAEVQPTDFIHASNNYCVTCSHGLLCLRFDGVWIRGGGVVLISLKKIFFFSFEVYGLFVVLFLWFCRLGYLGLFRLKNKLKFIPIPQLCRSSAIHRPKSSTKRGPWLPSTKVETGNGTQIYSPWELPTRTE